MKTRTINIYSFDELSDTAKEHAINEHREFLNAIENSDDTLSDAKEIAQIIGIDINDIYYSGFASQGDGACFTGNYQYKKQALKNLKAYAPQDKTLHTIAENLQAIQKENFYQLTASVSHRGHYYHEYCTSIEVYKDGDYAKTETEEYIIEELRDFMRWIYKRLETEYEYINSDEYIKENIIANEYEFLENGEIA